MPTIEVPGHGDVEFPDEMPQEQILAALKRLAPAAPTQRQPGQLEAGIEGGLQGASLGFGDEMRGAGVAAIKKLLPQSLGGSTRPMAEEYRAERDRARAENTAGEKAYPKTYVGSQIAGGLAPQAAANFVTGGTAALPMALAQGGAAGAGYSNADSPSGLARDAAVGVGVGGIAHGAGSVLGKTLAALGGRAAGGARQAESRAVGKAADEITAQIAAARGSLGGEVQKGNRLVENLRRLGPQLGPQEQQIVADLEQRLTQSNLQSLPGQAATIATKDAELAALKTGASQALKDRTADLLSTAEVKRKTMERALRYGPVAVGSLAGHVMGGPLGGAMGALAGAGTRPMVRSMIRLGKDPAVQKAVYDAVANAAPATGTFLKRALQAAAIGPGQEAALAP